MLTVNDVVIEIEKIAQRRNIKFPYVNFNKNNIEITDVCTITITEIEHWLCEFQKYYGIFSHVFNLLY